MFEIKCGLFCNSCIYDGLAYSAIFMRS
jgi:hypothetical protein